MAAEPSQPNLVPGRACGACTACCRELSIDDPELKKPGGVLCHNALNGGGCAIYETRPDACRVWFCGWRLLPDLGDDWRPDICGVLIGLYREEDGHKGAYFKVVGSLSVLNNPRLAAVVAGMIAADVSTTLSVQGQPATAPAHVLLNLRLARAVAAGDLGAIIHGLNDAARTAIRALRAAGTSIL